MKQIKLLVCEKAIKKREEFSSRFVFKVLLIAEDLGVMIIFLSLLL